VSFRLRLLIEHAIEARVLGVVHTLSLVRHSAVVFFNAAASTLFADYSAALMASLEPVSDELLTGIVEPPHHRRSDHR
jgi:hypothetical protein